MDAVSVAVQEESRSERMIRSFMEGAESGMLEVRSYGLTATERADALEEATRLYGVSEEPVTEVTEAVA